MFVTKTSKIRHTALVVGATALCGLLLFACSDDNPQSGGTPLPDPPNSDSSYRQQISLSGGYADRLDIGGGPWQASGPQEEVTLTFVASGLSEVKQFQIDIKLEPATAFDIEGTIFLAEDPFVDPFPNGVVLVSPTQVQMGAAILGNNVISGDKTLGTLKIRTSQTFGRLVQAQIGVERFSVGPSSSDRDEYSAETLNLGVVVNE